MDKELIETISSVLIDMPIGIEVGTKRFEVYPQTLGKMYITASLIESLGIDKNLLHVSPLLEALRVVKQKKDSCCNLIAYHCTKGKENILNKKKIEELSATIKEEFDDEDLATILILILKNDDLDKILKGTAMDKEAERMSKVNAAKKMTNTFVFGGRTIWGTLIDAACERYGWTLDYVLWGVSYNNLTLMLKDKITTIYLSDQEMKHCHVSRDREYVSGDDKEKAMKMAMESENRPN